MLRYPEYKSPYLISKRRPFNISDGKGNGNTSAYRDKIKVKR